VRRLNNHVNSQETATIEQYSASADDLEIVCYFFDFQEIKESPKNAQKPVTEHPMSGHPAQS
jgi:hypothetical protein